MTSCVWKALRNALVFALAIILTSLPLTVAALAKPAFSALAVDARTGEILFAKDIDGERYPASLTKMMTLYLVFEDLKSGRITKSTPIRFSKFAAARAPSKLGLRVGQTVTVDEAIRALVTKSANDVATALAENLAGSEPAFAQRMTRTARAIGMTRSTFRNASGLPDRQQRTTARDMATLGLRLQRDFPEYFSYFRVASFNYKGRIIRNHNRLLGKLDGVDGIKTGYIAASGFNLVTSAGRGDRRIVGVVMGGTSGNARNRYMAAMVEGAFKKAKAGSAIALAPGKAPAASALASNAAQKKPAREKVAVRDRTPDLSPEPDMSLVPTVVANDVDEYGNGVGDNSASQDEIAAHTGSPALAGAPGVAQMTVEAPVAGFDQQPARPVITAPAAGQYTMASLIGSVIGKSDSLFVQRKAEAVATAAAPIAPPPATTGTSAAEATAASLAAATRPATVNGAQPAATTASIDAAEAPEVRSTTWNIQIGAFPTEEGARNRLAAAKGAAAGTLKGKNPLTISATKGGKTLYRARYSGFSEREARDACKALTRKGVSCFAIAPQG